MATTWPAAPIDAVAVGDYDSGACGYHDTRAWKKKIQAGTANSRNPSKHTM
jgi:hypothetical protein